MTMNTSSIERFNVKLAFTLVADPTMTTRSLIIYDKESLPVHINNIVDASDVWLDQFAKSLDIKEGDPIEIPPAAASFQSSSKATHFILSIRSTFKNTPISDKALFVILTNWFSGLKQILLQGEKDNDTTDPTGI